MNSKANLLLLQPNYLKTMHLFYDIDFILLTFNFDQIHTKYMFLLIFFSQNCTLQEYSLNHIFVFALYQLS